MKNLSTFQIIILLVFGFSGLVGVILLATFSGSDSVPAEEQIGTLEIWGTYDSRVIDGWIRELQVGNQNLADVDYKEFSPQTFEREVLEALAENRAPGLLLLDTTEVFEQKDRIFVLGGETYSKAQFRQDFLQLAEVYFTDEGVMGVPLFADPLVMFWNRALFQSAGQVRPPVSWQEFFNLVPVFTQVGENKTISQSALPFGEAVNVDHYKEILATLALQSGNPITTLTDKGYFSALTGFSGQLPSADPALSYFTEFSNPASESYSWNRSLPRSQDYFLAGKAAVYFGFASEVRPLQIKNPNLNFDIAEVPQSVDTVQKSVYSRLYGLFIPEQAPNKNASFLAMRALSSQQALESLQEIINLGVVRRDLAGQTASDEIFTDIFRKEAIYAQTFIDPQPDQTDTIFKNLVESITSGRRTIKQALSVAEQEINVLFSQ